MIHYYKIYYNNHLNYQQQIQIQQIEYNKWIYIDDLEDTLEQLYSIAQELNSTPLEYQSNQKYLQYYHDDTYYGQESQQATYYPKQGSALQMLLDNCPYIGNDIADKHMILIINASYLEKMLSEVNKPTYINYLSDFIYCMRQFLFLCNKARITITNYNKINIYIDNLCKLISQIIELGE